MTTTSLPMLIIVIIIENIKQIGHLATIYYLAISYDCLCCMRLYNSNYILRTYIIYYFKISVFWLLYEIILFVYFSCEASCTVMNVALYEICRIGLFCQMMVCVAVIVCSVTSPGYDKEVGFMHSNIYLISGRYRQSATKKM